MFFRNKIQTDDLTDIYRTIITLNILTPGTVTGIYIYSYLMKYPEF
jgi:hypothetical protein